LFAWDASNHDTAGLSLGAGANVVWANGH